MTSNISTQKRECPHKKNHSRKISQTQNNIQYEIDCCDVCADIALKSDCGFTEVLQN